MDTSTTPTESKVTDMNNEQSPLVPATLRADDCK